MTSSCPSCAAPVSAQATFCSTCGLRLAGMTLGATYGAVPTVSTAGSLAAGMLIGGRYRLDAPLAVGAMGAVWRGTDERLHGRPCAIKSVLLGGATPDEQAERADWFARETEVLAGLRHPAICDIRDVVSEGAASYLILELVEGHTLAEELAARGNPGLPESEVLNWVRTLCEALSYLHAQTPPVIFRDLKPQNIMLRPDGRVTLIDFGIARTAAPAGGTAIGSPGYAPPEQYQGLADARSDVYGLAATVHHLLTGRDPTANPPFSFPSARSLVPALSSHVDAALAVALSMKPDDRFASVAAFSHALVTPASSPTRRKGSASSSATRTSQPALPGVERLHALVVEARRTGTPLPHILFVGPAPAGVTAVEIANWLAAQLGVSVAVAKGRDFERVGDLVAILTNQQAGDILLIEEVDHVRRLIRETLEPALNNTFTVDFIIGKGPAARSLKMSLQEFTVVGSVSSQHALSSPVASYFAEQIDIRTFDTTWRSGPGDPASTAAAPVAAPVQTSADAHGSKPGPATSTPRLALLVWPEPAKEFIRALIAETEATFRGRLQHPPKKTKNLEVSVGNVVLVPWYVAMYTVDATFSTSVGIIHHERGNDVVILDAQIGATSPDASAEYVLHCASAASTCSPIIDADGPREMGMAVYPTAMTEDALESRARSIVVRRHTRMVQYVGANNQSYSKVCVPSERQVTLTNELLLRTATSRVSATFDGQEFYIMFAVAPDTKSAPVLLGTDLPDAIPLCQQCGGLDDRDKACAMCGSFVCSTCLPADQDGYCSATCHNKAREEQARIEYERRLDAAI